MFTLLAASCDFSGPFVIGKFLCTRLADIRFGKSADAIKRGLQFSSVMLKIGIARVRWHGNQFADSHQYPREGAGN